MALFDGAADPCDHISQYNQKMIVTTAAGASKEACMCKGFGSTLSGPELQWFISLPNISISSFADLDNAFNQQFMSGGVTLKQPSDIYKIEKKTKSYSRPNIIKVAEKSQQGDSSKYPPRLAEYGFTTSIEGLLKALRDLGDQVRWPKPPTEERPNEDRYRIKKCKYHQDIGHKIEYCFMLRKEIKFQLRKENLDHLLPRVGLTYSAVKRRATEGKGDPPKVSFRVSQSDLPTITFDEADGQNKTEQHHDALIITLSIGNYTVIKVLVDTGSSVNLIMFETHKLMGFNKENLANKSVPLVGFCGETTHSIGEITILAYIKRVNKLVRYLVIEHSSTYNTWEVESLCRLHRLEKNLP
ncbi:uncharacterized protein LOC141627819 [Silene latifolia]|uniref:uncharacterized protein LOC141627819 n=1 Tax=Silene latifolia TaxID=37657 RepID=UPI003D76EE02